MSTDDDGQDEFDDHMEQVYHISDLETLPIDELQALYRQALTELRDVKSEYEEFQCRLFLEFKFTFQISDKSGSRASSRSSVR